MFIYFSSAEGKAQGLVYSTQGLYYHATALVSLYF